MNTLLLFDIINNDFVTLTKLIEMKQKANMDDINDMPVHINKYDPPQRIEQQLRDYAIANYGISTKIELFKEPEDLALKLSSCQSPEVVRYVASENNISIEGMSDIKALRYVRLMLDLNIYMAVFCDSMSLLERRVACIDYNHLMSYLISRDIKFEISYKMFEAYTNYAEIIYNSHSCEIIGSKDAIINDKYLKLTIKEVENQDIYYMLLDENDSIKIRWKNSDKVNFIMWSCNTITPSKDDVHDLHSYLVINNKINDDTCIIFGDNIVNNSGFDNIYILSNIIDYHVFDYMIKRINENDINGLTEYDLIIINGNFMTGDHIAYVMNYISKIMKDFEVKVIFIKGYYETEMINAITSDDVEAQGTWMSKTGNGVVLSYSSFLGVDNADMLNDFTNLIPKSDLKNLYDAVESYSIKVGGLHYIIGYGSSENITEGCVSVDGSITVDEVVINNNIIYTRCPFNSCLHINKHELCGLYYTYRNKNSIVYDPRPI
jgi:hypothetical protein